jgi:hypothetical protein
MTREAKKIGLQTWSKVKRMVFANACACVCAIYISKEFVTVRLLLMNVCVCLMMITSRFIARWKSYIWHGMIVIKWLLKESLVDVLRKMRDFSLPCWSLRWKQERWSRAFVFQWRMLIDLHSRDRIPIDSFCIKDPRICHQSRRIRRMSRRLTDATGQKINKTRDDSILYLSIKGENLTRQIRHNWHPTVTRF